MTSEERAPAGWTHEGAGKVRDLYGQPDRPDIVLLVASDRVSAFDHVLPTPVPDKGAVLTALTRWWLERLAPVLGSLGLPHHVLAEDPPPEVAGRALLCRRLDMVPVECVARGYLTGSGLADYLATGAVGGVQLPPGLQDGDRLPSPVFTPATKAEQGGHDENVTFAEVAEQVGQPLAERLREATLALYTAARDVGDEQGVLLADTKLELGHDAAGTLTLGDEVLTPDSSRFWPAEGWVPGQAQPSFDKQYVRDWLTSPASGWDRGGDRPPPALPEGVVERTRERYLEAYRRLTGTPWS